jgi:hypothetical protein
MQLSEGSTLPYCRMISICCGGHDKDADIERNACERIRQREDLAEDTAREQILEFSPVNKFTRLPWQRP